MNLNGAVDEIELPVNTDEVYVHNSWTDSIPAIIHGNGPSKVGIRWFPARSSSSLCFVQKSLNYLSNYIARAWSATEGCLQCKENVIDLTKIDDVSRCLHLC